jgi:putative PIN family toxin of toxin-antitoxin system
MKAVLDTNVWLDWLVFDDPSAHRLGRLAEAGTISLPASPQTRAEWLAVIERPQLRLGPPAQAAVALRYDRHAEILDMARGRPLPADVPVCADPDDQKFIELALSAGAAFLVSRDKALLRLARMAQRRHGLAIVHPEADPWLNALVALDRPAGPTLAHCL